MGTRTVQSILDRAWIQAHDLKPNKRWPSNEGLMWVADAQLAVVAELPRAYTQTAIVTAQPGTRQSLDALGLARGVQPVDITNNVSADGLTAGSPITKIARAHLDDYERNWHATSAQEADHWMTDDEDPKVFYLYPAISDAGRIRIVYAAMPPDLISLTQVIALDDIYAEAAQYHLLHSMFSKDITKLKSAQYAAQYLQMFERSLGLGDQSIQRTKQEGDAKEQGA